MLDLKYIVVGTGRCGTVSVAKFLTEMGIPCSHERFFTIKGLPQDLHLNKLNSWPAYKSGLEFVQNVIAEASWCATPYLNHPYLKNANIIHIVRDPMQVILTLNNNSQNWYHTPWNVAEKFILSNCDVMKQKTPLEKNCYFVINWNRLIEKKSKDHKYIRIRIEYDTNNLLDFIEIPNAEQQIAITNTFESWEKTEAVLGKNLGMWKPLESPVTVEDILNGSFGKEIEKLKKDYGYS